MEQKKDEDLRSLLEKHNAELRELLEKHRSSDEYLGKLNIQVGYKDHERVMEGLKKMGERVLFCTGSRAMRKYRLLNRYLELFGRYGLKVRHYDNISPNPTLEQMKSGIDVAKEFKPDIIFALGGGSIIDTAKIISIGLFGEIWEFVEKRKDIEKAIPIVACATTSGTGSHVTPYAVVTNTQTLEKKTLKNNLLLPTMSIVDLEILLRMPEQVVASTGFDVLCHAAEVYTREDCTDVGGEFCRRSLELIRKHLVASYEGDSMEDRLGMAYADIYAGIPLALIGTHLPHAISHPISARFPSINHGQALAYVFAETTRRQMEKNNGELNEKFREVSHLLGMGSNLVRTIRSYEKLLDLRSTKRFDPEDIEGICQDTMGYRIGSVNRCPAGLDEAEVREIIYDCLPLQEKCDSL